MPWYFKRFVLGLFGLTYLSSLFANTLAPNTFGYAGQPTNANTHLLIVDGHRRYNPNHGQFLAQSNTTPFAGELAANGHTATSNPISPTAIALSAVGGVAVIGGVIGGLAWCCTRRNPTPSQRFIDHVLADPNIKEQISKARSILNGEPVEGNSDFINSYTTQVETLFKKEWSDDNKIREKEARRITVGDIKNGLVDTDKNLDYFTSKINQDEGEKTIYFENRNSEKTEFRGQRFLDALNAANKAKSNQTFKDFVLDATGGQVDNVNIRASLAACRMEYDPTPSDEMMETATEAVRNTMLKDL